MNENLCLSAAETNPQTIGTLIVRHSENSIKGTDRKSRQSQFKKE
jgi:hypothetical protein